MSHAERNQPLRIAFLESTSQMGGAEHVLFQLVRRFPRNEISPLLVCPGPGELTERAARDKIPTLIVPLAAFASLSRVWGSRKILNPFAVVYDAALIFAAAERIIPHLERAQIDIVHTNTLFAHLYGGLAARRLRVPCVWHLHDAVETTRFGGVAGWVWRTLGNLLATRIVGSSRCAVRAFAGSPRAVTVYTGIEPSPLSARDGGGWRERLNLAPDARLLAYVRRIDWSKGLDVLAQAATEIVTRDPNTHFLILGAPQFGDAAYAAAVQSQIRASGLERNWHRVGYVKDAAQSLADVDCLVLPSRRESFPRVLLEAGLESKPVVAADVGGVSEIIESGVTGLLVPPQDPGALAQALLRVLHDPELARGLGVALHARVVADFDVRTSVHKFIELYRRMPDVPAPLVRSQPSHKFRTD